MSYASTSITLQGEEERRRLSLYDFLSSRGYYYEKRVVDFIENKIRYGTRKAFLLVGRAGTGKTSLAELVAEYLGARFVFFQCTPGTTEDDLLYKYIPSEKTRSGIRIKLGAIPKALNDSQRGKVVLLLDEFDKTRPTADALLLDVLQNYRVSLYIDEQEDVIIGNPDNLVVFITSNGMREFSEPLMRRLSVVRLKPLPTPVVYKVLAKRFKREIAVLLAQIYDDTITANLRKPATIQELIELGELIEKNPNVSLDELVRSIIIKYDEDWEKYVYYVKDREPYSNFKYSSDNEDREHIGEAYTPRKEIVESKLEDAGQDRGGRIREIIEKISKAIVLKPLAEIKPRRIMEEKEEVTLRIEDIDRIAYTNIIKTLKPEPTDNPAKLGKFELVIDLDTPVITSKTPLTLRELINLYSKALLGGEFFVSDTIVLRRVHIDKLIDRADRIRYYTRNRIFLEKREMKSNEFLMRELIDLELANIPSTDLYVGEIRAYVYITDPQKHVPTLIPYIHQSRRSTIEAYIKAIKNTVIEYVLGNTTVSVEHVAKLIRVLESLEVDTTIELSRNNTTISEIRDIVEKLRELVKILGKVEAEVSFTESSEPTITVNYFVKKRRLIIEIGLRKAIDKKMSLNSGELDSLVNSVEGNKQ